MSYEYYKPVNFLDIDKKYSEQLKIRRNTIIVTLNQLIINSKNRSCEYINFNYGIDKEDYIDDFVLNLYKEHGYKVEYKKKFILRFFKFEQVLTLTW